MITLAPLDTLGIGVDAGGTDSPYDVTGMIYDGTLKVVTGALTGNHADCPTTAAAAVTPAASGNTLYAEGVRIRNDAAVTRRYGIYIDRNDAAPDFDADTRIFEFELLTKESWWWDGGPVAVVYDANGIPKMAVISPIAATQADLESGTNLTTFVSPGRAHSHPSAAKFWVKCGVSGNILGSYNVTSVADTGTGVVTVTIATDFSSTNWACAVSVEATGTTWAVANAREAHIRSATQTAGVVAADCIDNTGTTNLVKDPTTWHFVGYGDQ